MDEWAPAQATLSRPGPGTVVCWRLLLDTIDGALEPRLYALLSIAEQARAASFERRDDRRRFVAARAALRVLLAAALAAEPRDLALVPNASGKPELAGDTIEFNVSHSGRIALVALADGIPVGVDVELVRTIPDRAELAEQFFHAGETADIAAHTESERNAAFLRCWTRKEAVAKAVGQGLGLALDRYRVSCRPFEPAALLIGSDDIPPVAQWSLFHLDPATAHIGAIALPRRPVTLVCRTLDLDSCVP